ncbi:DUF2617 family protein [Catenuloplanes indicus]|uniref:DUF2617 domain-containing protein n=1 Tax=Catenuloplanes indicus TaxID=137267 RepID=A0AAE3W3X3_9ACTN|nr:DUF2617 family protein [Catenuloplanes indicus]MDQ0367885.1 hypothetical protein [Catenuloplanes indicus]
MLVDLTLPYADTTAADLSFALGMPPAPALHVLEIPELGLQLRLLGASHQVMMGELSETVACLPGQRPDLPGTVTDERYRFAAEIRTLTPAEMSAEVSRLRAELSGHPHGLVGQFPGDPDAITALLAYPDGADAVGWRTWHAYPQTGELVETTTSVRLGAAA